MRFRVRRLIYHLHLAVLHLGAAWAILHFDPRWFLVSLALYVFLQIVGGNIALHRYFSHHSFATGAWRERLLIVVGNLTCLGSSLSWASTHRHHHRFADQANDCHSPHHLGVHKILVGFWTPAEESGRAIRHLGHLRWHVFFHRWYYLLHALIIGGLIAWDWPWFAYLYAVPNLMVYYALYSVVIFCHVSGYRNFSTADQSRNNPLVAIYTLGEGWHNNHHEYPNSHRNTVRLYEWDPTARVIEWFFKK
jgi:stearoyl-CoA desaturase (delta-9 desaturase)